jgi:hypothetical protein
VIPVDALTWLPGRDADRVVVVAEEAPAGARPRFPGWKGALGRYFVVEGDLAEARARDWLRSGRIERAYRAPAPVEPPWDIPPLTPDFRAQQTWLDPFPGLGFSEAASWPGGSGEHVRVVNIEYSYDASHEDLGAVPPAAAWGWEWEYYTSHGNGVLGILGAAANAYGATGGAPGAPLTVVHPFVDGEGTYDPAAAILACADLVVAGDVVLVEQQIFDQDRYVPVSIDPAVADAIRFLVDLGVVVVEPAANGAVDLDAETWGGAFSRDADSGSIMVAGGTAPGGAEEPRSWESSDYGERVDVQGWEGSIVTTSWSDGLTDLAYLDGDPRQAYTAVFGGTSGAAAQVAAMAAVVQSVSIATTGEPVPPRVLRSWLVQTGTPQTYGAQRIGPMPDLRRVLRSYLVP